MSLCLPKSRLSHLSADRTVFQTLPCPSGRNIFILKALQQDTETRIVAAFHFDGSASIFDVRAKQCLRTMKLHDEIVHSWTVFGRFKRPTSSPGSIFGVFDWQAGRTLWKKKLGEAGNSEAVWEGKAVPGTKDGRLLIFDLNSG